MSGFQEILVIALIFSAIFFIPRMKGRSRQEHIVKPGITISGTYRIIIALSLIHMTLAAAYFKPWEEDPASFLYIGAGPVLLGCLAWWVYDGFKKR